MDKTKKESQRSGRGDSQSDLAKIAGRCLGSTEVVSEFPTDLWSVTSGEKPLRSVSGR